MREFVDSKGIKWQVSVHVGSLERVRDVCGVDLVGACDGDVLARLADDEVGLLHVLHELLSPQIKERGLSVEQFFESITGDAIERALMAMLEDLADFFRDPAKRRLMKFMVAKMRETQDRAGKMIEQRLADPKIDTAIDRLMADAGKRFTDSLDSLGSTPEG